MPTKSQSRTDYMRDYMYIYRLKGDTAYQRRRVYLNAKIPCPCCNKCISRQNLKRHIKTQHHN